MKNFIQKTLVLAFMGSAWMGCAQAEETAPTAPTEATSITGSVNLLSQYRFRGIDQAWGRPALQGNIDWSHSKGFYAGLGASNISPRSYPGGALEVDVYGGYNGRISDDWRYTVGAYAYLYPGANVGRSRCPSAAFSAPCGALPGQKYHTLELNAGLSYKALNYKLSRAGSDYFGANRNTGYDGSTRGTLYHDLSLAIPLQNAWQVQLHAGHTSVRANYGGINPSYSDWRIALAKSWDSGWSGSIAAVGANNDRMYRPATGGLSATDGKTRALNRSAIVLQMGKSF